MFQLLTDIFISSLDNTIILGVITYSYFLYTIFYKNGKFSSIPNFAELLKIIIICLGVFILVVPLILYVPAIINYMQGKALPTEKDFSLYELIITALIFSFLPWLMKSTNKKFDDIKSWFKVLFIFNIIFLISILIGLSLSFLPKTFCFISNNFVEFRLEFMALIILFLFFIFLQTFAINLFPRFISSFEKDMQNEKERNKNKITLYKNMENKKNSFWKNLKNKLIEPEDNHLFGEIFLIIGGFLMIKWLDEIIPFFNGKEWIYFGIGFLFILGGTKLIRKSQ